MIIEHDHEAYMDAYRLACTIPTQQLVDLWTVKFGNEWVNLEDLDTFYRSIKDKLSLKDLIEQHLIPHSFNAVYRLKEKQ